MATKPLNANPVADLPENWTNGQTVAATGASVGLSTQHGYNYLMGKVNEALTDIGTINDAFDTNVPAPATAAPSSVGSANAVGSSTLYARADHVHAGPQAGTSNPAMNGTASAGSAATWSRSDHVHPTDTSRQAAITSSNAASVRNTLGLGNTSGAVPVANGGTGASTASAALTNLGAAAASHNHAAGDITSGTLGVARGGTGASSFTANSAIVSGSSTTAALTTRAITNNTAATSAITGSTNLVTMNTLRYALNRTTGPGTADTNYSTSMMRPISAGTADLTAGSSSLTSGAIYLVYEA